MDLLNAVMAQVEAYIDDKVKTEVAAQLAGRPSAAAPIVPASPPAPPPASGARPIPTPPSEADDDLGLTVMTVQKTATVGQEITEGRVHVAGGIGDVTVTITPNGRRDPGISTAGLFIMGTPTVPGVLKFDVMAVDSVGNTAIDSITITVSAAGGAGV